MQIHLIAVEISIVSVTISVMHSNSLFLGQNPGNMGHYTRLVKGGLSVDEQHVACAQVSIHYLPANSEKLCQSPSLLKALRLQVDSMTSFFVFDHISTRM